MRPKNISATIANRLTTTATERDIKETQREILYSIIYEIKDRKKNEKNCLDRTSCEAENQEEVCVLCVHAFTRPSLVV